MGWVCCWFSPLLREVFLRVLRFSPLLKNQHFKILIGARMVDEEPLCGCATSKYLVILQFFMTVEPPLTTTCPQRPLFWRTVRLSQSRSLGFLVWCSLVLRANCRATRSKARLVSKSSGQSTCWPSFLILSTGPLSFVTQGARFGEV